MLRKLLFLLIIGTGLAFSSPIYSGAPGSVDFDPPITYGVIEQAGDWGCLIFENSALDLVHYDCGGTDIWAPIREEFTYYPQYENYGPDSEQVITPEPKMFSFILAVLLGLIVGTIFGVWDKMIGK